MLVYLNPHTVIKFSRSINPFVKAFIVSDSLLYAAVNIVSPFFVLFLAKDISGGNVQIASFLLSVPIIVRILIEISASKIINNLKPNHKIGIVVSGLLLISAGYFGFAISKTIAPLFLFSVLNGIGWGICTPTKLSLFSSHLDKSHETVEWSLTDVINLMMIAIAVVAGGFIATNYGFSTLFLIAGLINFLSAVPYLFFYNSDN